MKTLNKYLILVLVTVLISTGCYKKDLPVIEKSTLDLSKFDLSNENFALLTGECEFYWDQFLYPDDFKKDTLPVKTCDIKIPSDWQKKLKELDVKNPNGIATYKFNIILKNNQKIYALRIHRLFDAARIYFDDSLVVESGKISEKSEDVVGLHSSKVYSFTLPNNFNDLDTVQVLVLVSNFMHNKKGICGKIEFGNFETITSHKDNKIILVSFFSGFILIMALYHLILYAFRKKNKAFLYFSLVCIFLMFRNLATDDKILMYFFDNFSFSISKKIEYISGYFYPLFIILTFTELFPKHFSRKINYFLISIFILEIAFVLIFPLQVYNKPELIYSLFSFITGFYIIICLIKAIIHKERIAIWGALGIFLILLMGVHDFLYINALIHTKLQLMPFGLVIYIVFQSYMLAKDYSNTFISNENLTTELKFKNENLEKIVEERTSEIYMQKEELKTQAETLLLTNLELEKLSLVASETTNAVVIMDNEGNFEWINKGFTKLYGLTFEELIKDYGKNLKEVSLNPQIDEKFSFAKNHKESVTYESFFAKKNGRTIWTQTDLTPVFDDFQNVRKFVAIDTDITKNKEYEIEIIQKSEEISTQNEEILAQKEEIDVKNQILASQNENMKASIRYAQTIQSTILPQREKISKFFDNFVLYKPKDIVSGDFYSFIQLSENCWIASVADCTGHGVPGAFMSLISSRILTETILVKKITSPAEILENIDTEIRIALNQESTYNNDGMDICLVRIDKINNHNLNVPSQFKIVFAGAKRPLYYVDNGTLYKLNGDRKHIGGVVSRVVKQFTNQEIILNSDDVIYMTSDGYTDQPNSIRQKIGTSAFETILTESLGFTPEKQCEIFHDFLNKWKTDVEQRDDITVFGIKL